MAELPVVDNSSNVQIIIIAAYFLSLELTTQHITKNYSFLYGKARKKELDIMYS